MTKGIWRTLGGASAPFPVLQCLDIYPKLGRESLLEQVELDPALPNVLSERPGGLGSSLGGDPVVWTGATQGLDVQMAKWQRIPRRLCI
jgi:hypothetical protein